MTVSSPGTTDPVAPGVRQAVPAPAGHPLSAPPSASAPAAFLRAENEDDDGYDPYSDRPCTPEPLWERDPWS